MKQNRTKPKALFVGALAIAFFAGAITSNVVRNQQADIFFWSNYYDVEEDELDDLFSQYGGGCESDEDCDEGDSCTNGYCDFEEKNDCEDDSDCPGGGICDEGECWSGGGGDDDDDDDDDDDYDACVEECAASCSG